ncbi:hypothetical protein RhiJN_02500 [Ceratobasidium sp. AG-Ba]|nr:hypothetical protein RhiJN_02500 [Ceratobasidium sp. AG-Ba]QRW03429.1 hypothetical protein RhiLY_02428 [Ceratobasidium sp. AG-Ba]
MSDNGITLGRGHRVSVKTPAMVEYTAGRNKSKQTVENIARTKNVQQQEAQLAAKEQAKTQTSNVLSNTLQATSQSQSLQETGAFDVLLARRAEDYTPKTKRLDTLHRAVIDASTLDYIYEQPQEAATHQARIRRRRRRIQNRNKAAKGKSKSKSTKPTTEPVSRPLDIDPEEARNVAETLKYERRCIELQFMIFGRTGKPIDELKLMDGDELEAEWQKAQAGDPVTARAPTPANPPAKSTSKASTSKPSTKKARDQAAIVATPAKKTRASSPLVPLTQAREQSARAELSSPAVLKRRRDISTERTDEDARCRRVVLNDMRIAPAKPLKNRKIVVEPAKSAPSSRAGSAAPSTISAYSKSGGSKRGIGHSIDLDSEMIDLGDLHANGGEEEDEEDDDEEMEAMEQTASRNGQNKKAPPRPKKSDYKGTIEGLVVDRAVDYIETALLSNPCPSNDEYELMIHQGWETGVKFYNKSSKVVKLTDQINRVIKSLISSFRMCGRRQMVDVLASHFGLDVSPSQTREDVKNVAAGLLPIWFHQDPEAKSEKAGHYRSNFVARAIATLFYFGPRPPALRSDADMVPMPEVTIAFSCAVAEEILMRYKKDGYIKVEQKAPKGQGQARNRKKGPTDKEIVPRTGQDELKDLMDIHLQSIEPFQRTVPRSYQKWLLELHDECLQWAGKSSQDGGNSKPAEGALTADSYADEEDISPEELNAVLNKSRARLTSVEPHSKGRSHSEPRLYIQVRPAPRPHMLLNNGKSSNLSGLPEDPNSNSDPDSRSSSGSESNSDSDKDLNSDLDEDWDSDNNPAGPGEIDELGDDSSERAVDMSNQGDQVDYDTQIGKDVGMLDKDDTEAPARKLAVKSARRKVMLLDDDEDEAVGGGDKVRESAVEAGTTISQGGVEPSKPGGSLAGTGTPDKAETPPDAPELMERGPERLSSPLSPEPALDPDNSARNSQAVVDGSGSAANGSRMNAVLDKLKERTATTRKQAAEQKMAENAQEELKGVEADAAGGAAKSSKAEKALKTTKAAAKKGKKSKR